MRKTIVVAVTLALAWLGYIAWPIYTLVQLTRAVEAGDVATVTRHIDFAAVRGSLTRQVIDTYARLTGTRVSPLARAVASSAGAIADPIFAKLISPEALTDLLRTGWPNAVEPQRPPGTAGLSIRGLGSTWQIFANADYGIRSFEISVPVSFPPDRQFGFGFRLKQWRWQLSSIRLPENIQVLLAESIIKSRAARPR